MTGRRSSGAGWPTGVSGRHRGRLRRSSAGQWLPGRPSRGALPERISNLRHLLSSAVPLDLLAEAARRTEVNLFLLSPCREYWGDIVPVPGTARLPADRRAYLDEGNPLLASLGKLGATFPTPSSIGGLDRRRDRPLRGAGNRLAPDGPPVGYLALSGTGEGGGRREIAPDDRSLQIHSCHSPLREIEVLHDTLLALLEETSGLAPRDIVVMTPTSRGMPPLSPWSSTGGATRPGRSPTPSPTGLLP